MSHHDNSDELIEEEEFEKQHDDDLARVYDQWSRLLDDKTISSHQLDAVVLSAFKAGYEKAKEETL